MTTSGIAGEKENGTREHSVSPACKRRLPEEVQHVWAVITASLARLVRVALSMRPGGSFWDSTNAPRRELAIPGVAGLLVWAVLIVIDLRLKKASGFSIVDLELSHDPRAANGMLTRWQKEGLPLARISVILDFLFVLLYSVFFYRLANRVIEPLRGRFEFLLWFPPFVATLDLLENLGLLWIVFSSPLIADESLVRATTILAKSKFLLFGTFLFLLVWASTIRRAEKVKSSFSHVRDVWDLVMLVRFSVLMLLVGVSFLFVGQWQEMLRAMTEVHAVTLSVASLIAGLSAWYTARVMYMFRFDGVPASGCDGQTCLKKRLPRLLGALMPVLVAVNVVSAGPQGDRVLLISICGQVVALAVFVAFVVWRRKFIRKSRDDEVYVFGQYPDLFSLVKNERDTAGVLFLLLLANFVMFGVFWRMPEIAIPVGGSALVLAAVATIIPIGSFVVYLGNRYRFPSVTVVFVLMIVFSLFNDNHRVRLYAGMSSTLGGVLPAEEVDEFHSPFGSLESYLVEWAADESRCQDREPIPLILVSAEGGGIRAAYWTAHVLGSLAEATANENRRFEDHVFALSGVSGGALGSAAFVSRMADRTAGPERERESGYVKKLHEFLGRDFLSPTIATLVFPDLMQRLLPVALFNDRAITLEESWEAGWLETFADCPNCEPRFRQPFMDLWSNEDTRLPLLFLNSTVVETGERFIVHPLQFEQGGFSRVFSNALDGHRPLGGEVPLSTAVHLSARFTYVSPAGTVHRPMQFRNGGDDWYRLVDGGYFDNSGTVTISELLKEINRVRESVNVKLDCDVIPFVIHISNAPVEEPGPTGTRSKWMSELLSPLRTLLHVRPARGYQARDALRQEIQNDTGGSCSDQDECTQVRFVHFRLCDSDVTLPLGWMLSESAKDEMQRQYGGQSADSCEGGVSSYNQKNEHQVLQFLENLEASGKDPAVRERVLRETCTGIRG